MRRLDGHRGFVSHGPSGVNTQNVVNQPCKATRSKVVNSTRNISFVRAEGKWTGRTGENTRESRRTDGDNRFRIVQLLYHFIGGVARE